MRIFFLIAAATIFFFTPFKTPTLTNINSSSYSGKFFVKTRSELKISEATGKVLLTTDIITLDEKISKYNITAIKKLFNINNGDKILYEKLGMSKIYVFEIEPKSEYEIENIVKDFTGDEAVEFSEPDYKGTSAGKKDLILKENYSSIVPNDEMFYKQWYLQNNGSVEPSGGGMAKVGADIKISESWEIEKGSADVIVAILDSGIKDDHPDLKERMWINKGEIPGNGIDDDQNGYKDDIKGWDFAYDDRRPEDGFGHGTNIATVIGASTNNLIGFSGIDQNCKLMNCKNLNAENTGEYSWWAESIKYAVDNGADIINMSEGGDDYSKVLKTAIEYAVDSGVFLTAAMMNKGDNRDYYPASYRGVFAVGATDTDDKRCKKFSWGGGSCWGEHISVVAPGNKIYGLDYESPDNYEVYWSGTSQSTAIVSGIASLLLSQDRSRSSEDLGRIIKLSSRDLIGDTSQDTPGWDQYYGYGRVDTYHALTFDKITDTGKEIEKKVDEKPVDSKEKVKEWDNNPDEQNTKNDKPAKAVERNNNPSQENDGWAPAKKK
ncbi:MAG: S8 family peptidase [Ignavibacteria bacterium]